MSELYDIAPGPAAPVRVSPIAALLQGDDVQHPPRTRFGSGWFMAALAWVVICAAGMALWLDRPMDRPADRAGAEQAVAARNLLREGFVQARGGAYLLGADAPLTQRQLLDVHPPGVVWALSGWMHLFGESDRALRAFPAAVSLVNLLLVYLLAARLFNPAAGLATTVVYSILPISFVGALTIGPGPLLIAMVLATSLGYLAWVRSRSAAGLMGMYLFAAIGCWIDWRMVLFCGLLAALHAITLQSQRRWLVALGLLLAPGLVFVAFASYLRWHGADVVALLDRAQAQIAANLQAGSGLERMFDLVRDRTSLKAWLIDWFTAPALALAGIGALLWISWSAVLARDDAGGKVALRVLLAAVVAQVLLTIGFADAALRDPQWHYPLALPIAVLAAGLCVGLTLATPRTVAAGVCDRFAWAIAALIPLLAATPLLAQLGPARLPWSEGAAEPADAELVRFLHDQVEPDRIILTNADRAPALAWYSDRAVVHRAGLVDVESVKAAMREIPEEARPLFLWTGRESSTLAASLASELGPPRQVGAFTLFALDDAPGVTPPATPRATQPATQPESQG